MSVPDFLPEPDAPSPGRDGPTYPWVISQRPDDDGTVLVTFALPGLRRATVRVPQSVWLDGHHLAIGAALARDPIVPPDRPYKPQDERNADDSP